LGMILLVACGLSAQNPKGRTGTNTAQAVLHIQVNVVPMVFAQQQKAAVAEPAGISYTIPVVSRQDQSIMEESSMGLPAAPLRCTGISCAAILRTTTVVAH